ncbi:MAG TPA: hypothetical protein VFF06_25885 [Polyangia bacterium]|nr:hypothetical protein [Polyangia bacterium]
MKQTAHQEYDAAENIVYVSFPSVQLETQDEIRAHFDRIITFWKQHCGGRRVYYVVNYDNISVNLQENDFYAAQMKRVLEHAITIVRYGGDPLQRTAARLANMKLHAPTRLYESRDEALAVVQSLKAGAPPPPLEPSP